MSHSLQNESEDPYLQKEQQDSSPITRNNSAERYGRIEGRVPRNSSRTRIKVRIRSSLKTRDSRYGSGLPVRIGIRSPRSDFPYVSGLRVPMRTSRS
ncbi:hypothetical protein AVEN_117956-1 [Araneus ventricosus]|uniref:Uncharacterized protein n=1 Tax=Araneus ventricosus TaxID=182803 RepID=A0A4Y2P6A6_ARAVE|nr:hypothetical protein AVEN_117956-1 [Araneus ventricosus]